MKAARKIATNLSVRSDLIAEAKAHQLNLSEVFEVAVTEALRRKRQEAWLEENREAIREYNERVERNGIFSDHWRKF